MHDYCSQLFKPESSSQDDFDLIKYYFSFLLQLYSDVRVNNSALISDTCFASDSADCNLEKLIDRIEQAIFLAVRSVSSHSSNHYYYSSSSTQLLPTKLVQIIELKAKRERDNQKTKQWNLLLNRLHLKNLQLKNDDCHFID
jgi:hypothetical protein